ncbi:carboxyvinyl-carboxyphosphonate phosphorylmutase [Streptomyces solincola]|uniref:Carboxyvinyl-carboxyphosphonate phosphorylmutase n=1 Tax=Streptomyces solincola TaxID=2100817 RepID=A0A2S9PYA0_9ACTN|nr:isocitrate lyase/PEP mutase family protein [Streptomyces solincola]PRH79333.1 carboxyvinyl-carboxyphosphonate phosphorylmutase [Streptomyces solincola]
MGHGHRLRDAIASPGTTPLIGVYDMYSASLAARHYDGFFLSGFGFAASYYGLPDIGFIAWPDIVAFAERLRPAFPEHHLLVDIDDGYADPEVACHVVRRLERAGVSGVVLEDQQRPRRCGHADGKRILPLEEYLDKLHRVLDSRSEMVVVARTDAVEEGEILRRAAALAKSGADVVLVDGVRDVVTIRRVREAVAGVPLLFNQIGGGNSPRLSLTELSELGVDVAIYSTPCLFAAHEAIDGALRELREADGRLPGRAGAIGVRDATLLLEANVTGRRTGGPA